MGAFFQTAEESAALKFFGDRVARLNAGEAIDFTMESLEDIPPMTHNGCTWNPADRVISSIMGGGSNLRYSINKERRKVTFERVHESRLAPAERAYVDPDRRDRYIYLNGVYTPRKT